MTKMLRVLLVLVLSFVFISCSKSQTTSFTELESAIKRAEDQLQEMELNLEDLREKGSDEEKIGEIKERIAKKSEGLEELIALLESRKKGDYQASAYQRDKGDVTANVISATEMHLTVQLKDSGRVMVFYVPNTRRVEGQRVPNTEVIKLVKELKKGQTIRATYFEGEEKGTYILQEIEKIDEKK
jgi:hypothetical protein